VDHQRGSPGQSDVWLAILASVLVSLAFAIVFAVLLIRYEADQIVAGLALWFIGLGFGPFMAVLVWDSRNSPSLESINDLTIPVLADIPVLGPIFFDTSPLVMFTAVLAVAAWKFLNDTRYGYWIQAAGENPEALDTAGISVKRVRYAAVIFSGVMAGLGGAVLLAQADRSLEPAKRWSAAADGLASSPTCSGTTTRLGQLSQRSCSAD